MNTDKAMAEAVKEIMGWLRNGGEFVVAQAPDIARELLMRDLVIAYTGLGAGAAILIVMGIFLYKTRHWQDSYGGPDIGRILITMTLGLFTTIIVATNLSTIIQIKYAPKLYVIEHMARLAK